MGYNNLGFAIITTCGIGGASIVFSIIAVVCGLIVWACVLYLVTEWWHDPGTFFIALVFICVVGVVGLAGLLFGMAAIVCIVIFGGLILVSPLLVCAACGSPDEGGGTIKIHPIVEYGADGV